MLGQTKRGINHLIKDEVKCQVHLLAQYAKNPDMMAVVPSPQQIQSYKNTLTRSKSGGWRIDSHADLLEWAAQKMCQSSRLYEYVYWYFLE